MASQDLRMNSLLVLRKMSWAILSTNLFGMPILLVFIGGILNLAVGQIWDSFQRDPYFFIIFFGSIVVTGGVFVAIHYYLVIRYLRPVFRFLEAWGKEKAELKQSVDQAMRASLSAPYYSMYLSMFLYVSGITLLIVFINLIFRLTWSQILSLFFTSISVGILVSFFQYFTSRRVLVYLNDAILLRFPELVEDENLNNGKYRIRNRMLLAIITLCMALVIITGFQAYNYALRSFQYDDGRIYINRLGGSGSC